MSLRNSLYPASSRLNSVPPRHYDVISSDGDLLLSDIIYKGRAKASASERLSRIDGWKRGNPRYNDIIQPGERASPGQFFPRCASEFSREILSASRSVSPSVPEAFNIMNKERTEIVRDRLHESKQKAMYPGTFRARSSSYNPVLGRYMTNSDSPGFRYYRYGSSYSSLPNSMKPIPSRYSSRLSEVIYVPRYL